VLPAVNRVAFIEVIENCTQTKQVTNFLPTLVLSAQRGMSVRGHMSVCLPKVTFRYICLRSYVGMSAYGRMSVCLPKVICLYVCRRSYVYVCLRSYVGMSAKGHVSLYLPKVPWRYACLRSYVCRRTAVRRNISFPSVPTCGRPDCCCLCHSRIYLWLCCYFRPVTDSR
jgi:hypothetical protein